MLADPESATIRRFRMIDPDNTENNVPDYAKRDVAYPGYFVVNRSGVIIERFVDPRYDDRRTGNAMVATLFPELLEGSGRPIAAPHLQVTSGQTDSVATLGSHLKLFVDLALPRGVHVYAPGVQGYRAIELTVDDSTWFKAAAPAYPRSRMLKLKPIHEIVPVYEKRARVTVDLVVANTGALMRELARTPDVPTPIAVAGRLTYQACDDKVCYTPAAVPLTWNLLVRLPDQKRTRPDR